MSVALGLGSRSALGTSVDAIAVHAGDVLWATCLYFGLALLFPRAKPVRLLASTLLLSIAVEISQSWHPAWLDSIRRNPIAQLFLGTGWQWQDLPRYAVGALLAWVADRCGGLGRSSPPN